MKEEICSRNFDKGMKALGRNDKLTYNEEYALHWKGEPVEELELLLKDIKGRLKTISSVNSPHAKILILKIDQVLHELHLRIWLAQTS